MPLTAPGTGSPLAAQAWASCWCGSGRASPTCSSSRATSTAWCHWLIPQMGSTLSPAGMMARSRCGTPSVASASLLHGALKRGHWCDFTATGYVIVTSSLDGTVRAFDLTGTGTSGPSPLPVPPSSPAWPLTPVGKLSLRVPRTHLRSLCGPCRRAGSSTSCLVMRAPSVVYVLTQ